MRIIEAECPWCKQVQTFNFSQGHRCDCGSFIKDEITTIYKPILWYIISNNCEWVYSSDKFSIYYTEAENKICYVCNKYLENDNDIYEQRFNGYLCKNCFYGIEEEL